MTESNRGCSNPTSRRWCEPYSQHTLGLRFIEVFCSVSLRFFAVKTDNRHRIEHQTITRSEMKSPEKTIRCP